MIKEGKIKKEKALPEISEDEFPFEIPENWKWVRLSTIGITQTGNTPSKSHPEYIGIDIPFITPGDILNGQICYNNQALSLLGKNVARVCDEDSIMQVCIGGSIGKVAITDRKVAFNQQINVVSPLFCLSKYLPFIKDWGALIIAGISLLVAIISLFKSSKAQRLQNKVNELELKIKQNELDKIAKEKEDSVLACVEARFITVGKGKHRLKVWNSGNATAYNVSARFDGDVGIMIMDREKQPFEELEARKSYELILITHNGSASKFRIITEWTDSSGKQHTKTQMGDFS